MELGSISLDALVLQQSYMDNVKAAMQLDTSIMKEVMDTSKVMSQEMLKMLSQPGVGQVLDVRV